MTDPSLQAPLVVEPEEGEEEGIEDDGPDLLDLTPEPPAAEEPEAESEPTIEDVPKA